MRRPSEHHKKQYTRENRHTGGGDEAAARRDPGPAGRAEVSVDTGEDLALEVPDEQVIDLAAGDDVAAVAGDVHPDRVLLVLLGELEDLGRRGRRAVGLLCHLLHLYRVRQVLVDNEGLAVRRPADQSRVVVLDVHAQRLTLLRGQVLRAPDQHRAV